MTNCKHHPDYTNELPRLNKIAGQINGIKKMIEDRSNSYDTTADDINFKWYKDYKQYKDFISSC